MDWLYPLCGFVVGALVGLTGMGGGSLMTPLLILLFGVHPCRRWWEPICCSPRRRKRLAPPSIPRMVTWTGAWLDSWLPDPVPATVLTIWVLSRAPKQSPTTAAIISMSIGVTLIIAAVAIFLRRRIRDYALARADYPSRTRHAGPITVVFGAVLGVLYPCAP